MASKDEKGDVEVYHYSASSSRDVTEEGEERGGLSYQLHSQCFVCFSFQSNCLRW